MSGYSYETPEQKLKRIERNMRLYIAKWNAACRVLTSQQIYECSKAAYEELGEEAKTDV
jgi:tartrate dehydratase beta subunit/fumarate hydratase class I family protein